jgi:hypothetical protein
MALRRILLAALTASPLLLLTTTAAAQERFGEKGQFILSVDRVSPLFAYTSTVVSAKTAGPGGTTVEVSQTYHRTSSNLLWTGAASDGNLPMRTNLTLLPRFAFDFVVVSHLTLGGSIFGSIGFDSSHDEVRNNITISRKDPTLSAFGIYPRVGYVIGFNEVFAFWPRGGLTFLYAKSSNDDVQNNGIIIEHSTSLTALWFTAEAMFAVTPVPHFGFTFGPLIDVPIVGSTTTKNGALNFDGGQKELHFGITAGLLGYI